MHETKTDSNERKNRQLNNNSWRLQYPLSIMHRPSGWKVKKKIRELNNVNQISNRHL